MLLHDIIYKLCEGTINQSADDHLSLGETSSAAAMVNKLNEHIRQKCLVFLDLPQCEHVEDS